MADYQFINATGLVMPDTGQLLETVESEWRAAFGGDLVTSPETPQGVMIAAEVESRDAVVRNNAELANQINPDYAEGVFLDGIWRLMGGGRFPATYSLVDAELTGTPGTVIPAGVEVATEAGDLFALVSPVVLAADGTGEGQFRALEAGPVAALAGTLTQIQTVILGWETATNPAPAAVGDLEETEEAARRRRRLTLALQSAQTPEAVQSRLANIPGYRSHSFRENLTNAAAVIDGVNLGPHSIYVCVDGGTDADVAWALLTSKGDGAGWNGATVVAVVEPFSGQSYDVAFDRPATISALVRVTAKFNGLDGQALIPAAIAAYAAGTMPGEGGLTVGQSLSAFELAGAINRTEPRLFVSKVELSTDGLSYSTDDLPATIQQKITIANVQAIES